MRKQGQTDVLRKRDLTKKLRHKYRNSIVFESQIETSTKKFDINAEKIKKRKIQKEKTYEQKMDEYIIDKTEEKYLIKVFEKLAKNGESFGKEEILQVLNKMDLDVKLDVDLMVWEFDEDLDKKINQKEFITMYKQCMMDKVGSEPKKLFHLSQFLMFCRNNKYHITVQDTLQLLFVRSKNQSSDQRTSKSLFEEQIKTIFGEDYETEEDGIEQQINFQEYLQKINRKAVEKRRIENQKMKIQFKYN